MREEKEKAEGVKAQTDPQPGKKAEEKFSEEEKQLLNLIAEIFVERVKNGK